MSPAFPWLRWAGFLWLAVWLPAYWSVWGGPNFLHLSDIAVVLTCIGLWNSSAVLLSSQAINSMAADLAWCLDAGWRLVLGHHLVGGTEYMWDPRYPLFVRLLSLFHIFLPMLLVWSLRRVGYDRRGLLVQSAIAALVLALSRLVDPARNINYAFRDPLFGRSWGPAPIHIAVIFAGILVIFYWPTHLVLARFLPPPAPDPK